MSQKKSTRHLQADWHPWDIKAALGKKGYSFVRVARENDYARTSANDVLRRPWPAMERIIADIIGVEPWTIWPSRYDKDNRPIRRYGAVSSATSRSARPTSRRQSNK